jgi:hypothetical protein
MDGSGPAWAKVLSVAANTMARPVAVPGALMRSYSESGQRIKEAGRRDPEYDRKLEELQRERRALQTPAMDRLSAAADMRASRHQRRRLVP